MKKEICLIVINFFIGFNVILGQNSISIDTTEITKEYIDWISQHKELKEENKLLSNNQWGIYYIEIYPNLFDQFKFLRISNKNLSHTIELNIFYDVKAKKVIKENTYNSLIDFNKLISKSNQKLNELDKSILYFLVNYRQVSIINPFFFNKKIAKKSYLFTMHNKYYSIFSNRDMEKLYSYIKGTKYLSNNINSVNILTTSYSQVQKFNLFKFTFNKTNLIKISKSSIAIQIE